MDDNEPRDDERLNPGHDAQGTSGTGAARPSADQSETPYTEGKMPGGKSNDAQHLPETERQAKESQDREPPSEG